MIFRSLLGILSRIPGKETLAPSGPLPALQFHFGVRATRAACSDQSVSPGLKVCHKESGKEGKVPGALFPPAATQLRSLGLKRL